MRMLDNVMKQLQELPAEYKDFYARKLVMRVQDKCYSKITQEEK